MASVSDEADKRYLISLVGMIDLITSIWDACEMHADGASDAEPRDKFANELLGRIESKFREVADMWIGKI